MPAEEPSTHTSPAGAAASVAPAEHAQGAWQPVPTRRTVMPAPPPHPSDAPLRGIGPNALGVTQKLLWAALGSVVTLLLLGLRRAARRP